MYPNLHVLATRGAEATMPSKVRCRRRRPGKSKQLTRETVLLTASECMSVEGMHHPMSLQIDPPEARDHQAALVPS